MGEVYTRNVYILAGIIFLLNVPGILDPDPAVLAGGIFGSGIASLLVAAVLKLIYMGIKSIWGRGTGRSTDE